LLKLAIDSKSNKSSTSNYLFEPNSQNWVVHNISQRSNGWISLDLNKTELTRKLTSYCSTRTTSCQSMHFWSTPYRMKATSRHATYPKIGMLQRWKREKSVGDQNCPANVFPFVFHEISDDDFCQTDCVPSNGQLVEECEKNNISKNQHDPTVDSRDIATRALLAPPNSAFLSLAEFSLLSLTCFCWIGGLFTDWKAHFPLITMFSLIYDFMYFILFFM